MTAEQARILRARERAIIVARAKERAAAAREARQADKEGVMYR